MCSRHCNQFNRLSDTSMPQEEFEFGAFKMEGEEVEGTEEEKDEEEDEDEEKKPEEETGM